MTYRLEIWNERAVLQERGPCMLRETWLGKPRQSAMHVACGERMRSSSDLSM